MKYSIVVLLFISLATFAQSNFQKGYYINNSGEKVEGFIANKYWNNTPSEIEFKNSLDSSPRKIPISSFSGFQIDGASKYIKRNVDVFSYSENISEMSYSPEVTFENKEALVKVLIEGEASLATYSYNGVDLFYYSKNQQPFISLVYKPYRKESSVTYNNQFKQTLYTALADCDVLSNDDFNSLRYKQNALIKLFKKYNECLSADFTNFEENSEEGKFQIKLKAGANLSSVNVVNDNSMFFEGDFGSTIRYRVNLELEYIIPVRTNQLGFFGGLAKMGDYEETIIAPKNLEEEPDRDATLVLKSIEVPLGFRYYFVKNEQQKFSLHTGYLVEFISDNSFTVEDNSFQPFDESTTTGNFFLGAGYHYGRFELETRLDLGRNSFVGNESGYNVEGLSLSLTLGYSFL